MNKLHLPNELVEWVFIIIGVTIAALAGAGIKTWLDNQLDGSGVEGWAPGVAALVVFFVLAAPFYFWASRSARARGEKTADEAFESEDPAGYRVGRSSTTSKLARKSDDNLEN